MDDLTRQHEYAELCPYPPTIPPFSVVAENPWPVRIGAQPPQYETPSSLLETILQLSTDPWSEAQA